MSQFQTQYSTLTHITTIGQCFPCHVSTNRRHVFYMATILRPFPKSLFPLSRPIPISVIRVTNQGQPTNIRHFTRHPLSRQPSHKTLHKHTKTDDMESLTNLRFRHYLKLSSQPRIQFDLHLHLLTHTPTDRITTSGISIFHMTHIRYSTESPMQYNFGSVSKQLANMERWLG